MLAKIRAFNDEIMSNKAASKKSVSMALKFPIKKGKNSEDHVCDEVVKDNDVMTNDVV